MAQGGLSQMKGLQGCVTETFGGWVILYLDISVRQMTLFREDRVHLSEWGTDIWLHNIWDNLLSWL